MELTAAALWLNTVFAGFDASVTMAIHSLYDIGGWFFTPFFEAVSFIGHDGIPLIILSVLLALFKKTRRAGIAMCIGIALGALATNLFIKVYVARPRPYLNDFYRNLWLLVGQNTESDMSFPSGHVTATFACMVPIFMTWDKRKSWLAILFAVLMAVSRIYLVVHYPSDVIGGIIIGTVAGVLGKLISLTIPDGFYEYSLFQKHKM